MILILKQADIKKISPEKKCHLCSTGEVEDEIHFLLNCNKYYVERQILFNSLKSYSLECLYNTEKLLHTPIFVSYQLNWA